MSVERLGLTVAGMLVFLVLLLFVAAAMVCRLPCY
jgi:K+-transporting ATPase A subunit